ncbi:hypothetical protein BGZ98_007361 [Dissophora globulifera]|nr:hypothetical protein BGZ98_007361 [Dissophora globulifera]
MIHLANIDTHHSMDVDGQQPRGYFMEHILRAHSRSTHDGQDENDIDVWAVAFQPTLPVLRSAQDTEKDLDQEEASDSDESESDDNDDEDEEEKRRAQRRTRRIAKEMEGRQKRSSGIVATCGGNTVCLIDCRAGRVVNKYSHVFEEEFMCMAWTTLDHGVEDDNHGMDQSTTQDVNNSQDQSNILAAAGRMGSIKLINPIQNTCYKYLHGHTATILRLRFSLTNPRWLFSASVDGTARLWDIGSLANYESEACCLAKFVSPDDSSVTAIGVCEKYLIIGTEKGLMAQYNLFDLEDEIEKNRTASSTRAATLTVEPERIYPPSGEWHESAVDEILYIPYFSARSYASIKIGMRDHTTKGRMNEGDSVKSRGAGRGRGRGRGRGGRSWTPNERKQGRTDNDTDEVDGEFVFASRENCQGEIIVWDASRSTETDAVLKTILEWSISESWTKFSLAENIVATSAGLSRDKRRQNVLIAGSGDGKVVLFDLGVKPKKTQDGNIVASKPSLVLSHPDSTELFRDVAVSQDLSIIVAGDWSNRVFIWNFEE